MSTASTPATTEDALASFAAMVNVYEHRGGHVCRAVASHLPALLPDSLENGGRVLDNACGTGAVTEELLKVFPKVEISAADVLPAMVNAARAIVASKPLLAAQVKEIRVEDGQSLTFADASFDASITNFAIFVFPDPAAGAGQIYRTLKSGGVAVVTVWKALGWKSILFEVQARVKPANPLTEVPFVEPWTNPKLLESTLTQAGFKDVKLSTVEEALWGKDKDDFIQVLLENFGAMVSKSWTEEESAKLASATAQVINDMESEFCIRDGDRMGCKMEALVAAATKQ